MQTGKFIKNKYILLFSAVFFLWQMFAAYNYYFYSGWDAETVFQAVQGCISPSYLSTYPNNIVLIWLFSHLYRNSIYFSLIAFQGLISWSAGLMLWYMVLRLFNSETVALVAYAFYIILVGLSPWVSIPYSDSVGLLFPVLILFIWKLDFHKRWLNVLRWVLLGFLGYMAYQIKPQAAITFIAVVIVEGFRKNRALVFSVAGVLCAVLSVNLITASLHVDLDKEAAFGPAHFLMMGMNESTAGVYSFEDVGFSSSFATRTERAKADLARAGQRVKDMGFGGFCRHVARKLGYDYLDGTFAWGAEGYFFREYVDEKIPHVSAFFRSFYYPEGEHYKLWSTAVQIVWIILLCLSVIGLFFRPDPAIILSMLGILAFCILFETRARYLYLNVPVFIISASYGMKGLFIHED